MKFICSLGFFLKDMREMVNKVLDMNIVICLVIYISKDLG